MKRLSMHLTGLRALVVGLALLAAMTVSPARAAEPSLEQMQSFMTLMQGYYALLADIHAVSADADKAAILQMMKAKEFYDQSGDRDKAVALLREVADKHRSVAVRNAAVVMLGDALNEGGDKQEAAAVMERVIRTGMK